MYDAIFPYMKWINLVVVIFLGFMVAINHGFHFSFSISRKKYPTKLAVSRNRNKEYNDFAASSPKNIIGSDSFLQWVSSRTDNTGIIPVGTLDGITSEDSIHRNKFPVDATDASTHALRYFSRMESVAPNDMISSFAQSAPKHTQDAYYNQFVWEISNFRIRCHPSDNEDQTRRVIFSNATNLIFI